MAKYDLFISYSRRDIETVKSFVSKIKDECKDILIWFDITGIESGEEFEDKIVDAIDNSDRVIFFMSKHALNAKWTKDEIRYALNANKRIIPILLNGYELTGWYLFRIGKVDCIDARKKEQVEKFINDMKRRYDRSNSNSETKDNVISEDHHQKIVNTGKNTFNFIKFIFNNFIQFISNNIKYLISIILICILTLAIIIAIKSHNTNKGPNYLTSMEIEEVIDQYWSTKNFIFNGFYLTVKPDSDLLKLKNDTFNSKVEVLNFLKRTPKSFILKNKNDETLKLPGITNSIDSIYPQNHLCQEGLPLSDDMLFSHHYEVLDYEFQPPFFEYKDDNGFKRVVILFNDKVYYYLGDCGKTNDGKTRHIICDSIGNHGIIDSEGNVIRTPTCQQIKAVEPNSYAYTNGGKWHYVSNEGNDINIDSEFPEAVYISKVGLVRTYNVDSKYEDQNKFGYQNLNGELVIPYKFTTAKHFNDKGYASVGIGEKVNNKYFLADAEKYGVISVNGDVILPFEYDYVFVGHSDTIKIVKNGLCGLMDITDKSLVLPCKYKDCVKWAEGFWVKELKYEKYHYIDNTGKSIFKSTYDYAGPASANLSLVRLNGKFFYINSRGGQVSQSYCDATWFGECGIARVNKDGKTGFINEDFKTIIPFIFDESTGSPFNDLTHLAQIYHQGEPWYINMNGALAYPSLRKPYDQ